MQVRRDTRVMKEATHMVFNVGMTFAKKARSAPAVQQYHSPMRQHKRTPSQHREIKVGVSTGCAREPFAIRYQQGQARQESGRLSIHGRKL